MQKPLPTFILLSLLWLLSCNSNPLDSKGYQAFKATYDDVVATKTAIEESHGKIKENHRSIITVFTGMEDATKEKSDLYDILKAHKIIEISYDTLITEITGLVPEFNNLEEAHSSGSISTKDLATRAQPFINSFNQIKEKHNQKLQDAGKVMEDFKNGGYTTGK